MAFRALLSSQRSTTTTHACSVDDASSSSALAASAAAAAARAAAAGAAGGSNPLTAFLSSITTDPLRTRQLAEGYNVGEANTGFSKDTAAAVPAWTPQQLLSSADSSEQRFAFAADDAPLLAEEQLQAVENPARAADAFLLFPAEEEVSGLAAISSSSSNPPSGPILLPHAAAAVATAPGVLPAVTAVAARAEPAAAAAAAVGAAAARAAPAAQTDDTVFAGRLGDFSAWRAEWESSRGDPDFVASSSYCNSGTAFPFPGAAAAPQGLQPPAAFSSNSSSTYASLLPYENVAVSSLDAAAAAIPLAGGGSFQQQQQREKQLQHDAQQRHQTVRELQQQQAAQKVQQQQALREVQQQQQAVREQQQPQAERWYLGRAAEQEQHFWTEAFQRFCVGEQQKAALAGGDEAAADFAAPLLPIARFPQRQQQAQQHQSQATAAATATPSAAESPGLQLPRHGAVFTGAAAAAPASAADAATGPAAAAYEKVKATNATAVAGQQASAGSAQAAAPSTTASDHLPLLQTPNSSSSSQTAVAGFRNVLPVAAPSVMVPPPSQLFSVLGSSSSSVGLGGGAGGLPLHFAAAAATARELERLEREEQERVDLWNYTRRLAAEAEGDVQLDSAAAAAAAASSSSAAAAAAFQEAAAAALRDAAARQTAAPRSTSEEEAAAAQQLQQQQNPTDRTAEQAAPGTQFFDAEAARGMLESMRRGMGEEKFARSEFAYFISKIADKEVNVVDNKLVDRDGELVDWEAEWQQHLLAAESDAASSSSSAAGAGAGAAAAREAAAEEQRQQQQRQSPVGVEQQQQQDTHHHHRHQQQQQGESAGQQETPEQQRERAHMGTTVPQREREEVTEKERGGGAEREKLFGDADGAEASAAEQQQQAEDPDGEAFVDSMRQLKAEWLRAHELGEIDEEELGLFNSIVETAELRDAFGLHMEEEIAAACRRSAAGGEQAGAAAADEADATAAEREETSTAAAAERAGEAEGDAVFAGVDATTTASSRLRRAVTRQRRGRGEETADSAASPLQFATCNPFADAAAPLALALQLLQQGRLQEAILALQVEVQQNPTSSEGWRLLGEALADSEQDTEAIACLRKGHEVDPYNLDSLLSLGVSLTNDWDAPEALRFLRTWLCAHDDFASLEGLQEEVPEDAAALEQHVVRLFEEAATKKPQDADMHLALGVLSHIQQRWDNALFHFAEALKFSSGLREASLWNKLGATLANSGRSAAALLAYEQALSLRINYPRAWTNTGVAYANLGDFKEALRHYLAAFLLNPAATHLWQYLRSALVGLGRLDLLPFVKKKDLQGLQKLLPRDLPADKDAVLNNPLPSSPGDSDRRLMRIFEMIS